MAHHHHTKPPKFALPSNEAHEKISALFLGPKGENAEFLQSWFTSIVEQQKQARLNYFPEDQPSITASIQESPAFTAQTNVISENQTQLLLALGQRSVPFYSPRYSAHMSVDQSLPAILGYLSTMFYNPNNVAFEASPFTTIVELEVGLQLCEMLGYNRYEDTVPDESGEVEPVAWGHIACDGSVANLESVWASRNLKFYTLALREAIADGNELAFISESFSIETCQGTSKLLKDCTVWEMLNFKTRTILDIPERLNAEYRISPEFLSSTMSKYIIQTVNKDTVMQKWGITQQPAIIASSTKHYSWPKAAGIGSTNLVDVPLDIFARVDTAKLDILLQQCLDQQRAVYQVVAVIGTTEEGAVDRIEEIVALREKYEKLGMSFVVHADAAWGGYFSTMLPPRARRRGGHKKHMPVGLPKEPEPFVPPVGLREDTAQQLSFLGLADSITVDPHKAGYIPYPAGALCYRDGRMKDLLTWSAVYLHQGSDGVSIGIYGVEGSKPGAAPVAVYMAHESIGLTPSGHGSLLGQAMYTCRRYAAHWSAMSTPDTGFVVTPFNPLPSELGPDPTPEKIEAERQFIRDHILYKSNIQIYSNADAMTLLNKLGSDLNINVFACNFRYSDGTLNTDVEESNWLNRRIFERLSVTSADEDPLEIPFYLTSTTFTQHEYGAAAEEMRKRMGLIGTQDLVVLRNVVMSPFTTTGDFVGKMADVFQQVLQEEVENARRRNQLTPSIHTFLVHGTGTDVFLVHIPTQHMANGRRQIILSAHIQGALHKQVTKITAGRDASEALVIQNVQPMLLDDIVNGSSFEGTIGLHNQPSTEIVQVSNILIVKRRSLMTEDLDVGYPTQMPFYLYGTEGSMHIDHVLLQIPNIQLSAGGLTCTFETPISSSDIAEGVVVVAENIHEASMQPFPLMKYMNVDDNFFFSIGKKLSVTVYKDPYPASTMDPVHMSAFKDVITTGEITLVGNLYVDSDALSDASEATEETPVLRTVDGKLREDHVAGWKQYLAEVKTKTV
ncbi:hypothetical protein D9619_008287 [Psilocybe cf. subviscida]|uniref:PLP-dependent transferase n=1 Tax=Psilocybe cf. subviscida TaxID=2480587 RepID=A0A8H5BAF6_9AGAR|nr:hypothetical protein D9619_008287 [Psilocybe cf. subviscida]